MWTLSLEWLIQSYELSFQVWIILFATSMINAFKLHFLFKQVAIKRKFYNVLCYSKISFPKILFGNKKFKDRKFPLNVVKFPNYRKSNSDWDCVFTLDLRKRFSVKRRSNCFTYFVSFFKNDGKNKKL